VSGALGGSWRLALRLARRDARRGPLRAVLTLLLIAAPVTGLTAAAVLVRSAQLPASAEVERQYGQAVGRLYSGGVHRFTAPQQAALAVPPSGVRLLPESLGDTIVGAGGRSRHTSLRELRYDDPLARGLVAQRSGRAPRTREEVTLSPRLLQRLHLGLGGRVTARGVPGEFSVVGTAVSPDALRTDEITGFPGALGGQPFSYLVGLSNGTPLRVLDPYLPRTGGSFSPRPLFYGGGGSSPPTPEAVSSAALVVVLALLEAALAAGTAFAVGARRQRRSLALLAVNGARGRDVGRVLLAQGLFYGVTGALFGTALGLGVGRLGLSRLESYGGRLLAGTRVPWLEVVGAAAFGLAAALLAAALPARLAARVPARAALTGQRGATSTPRWITGIGVALIVIGGLVTVQGATSTRLRTAQTSVALLGVVLLEVGAVACCPVLIGAAARLGGRLPAAPRLALRDAARQRARSGPTVAAVAAAVSGAMAVSVFLASTDARDRAVYLPHGPRDQVILSGGASSDGRAATVDLAAAEAALQPLHPSPFAAQLRLGAGGGYVGAGFVEPTSSYGPPVAGGVDLLRTLGADPARDADLLAGRAVVADPRLLHGDTLTVEDDDARGHRRTVRLPAVQAQWPAGYAQPGFIVSPEVVRSAGLRPGEVQHRARIDPTASQATRASVVSAARDDGLYVQLESGYQSRVGLVQLALLGVAALLALGVTAVATALAGSEARDDLAVLGAVGAAPSLRRRYGAAQAGVTAVLGGGLGLLIGLVPAAAVIAGRVDRIPFTVPWQPVAAFLVALPLLAAFGGALLTRSRLPQVARRA